MAKKEETTRVEELAAKLGELDALKRRLTMLEHELATEVAAFGRSKGLYGFTIDHLRVRLNTMAEMV